MHAPAPSCAETGLEVIEIEGDSAYAARKIHVRDAATQMLGMQRIAHAFVEKPDSILNELVKVAVDLCGADSAGISVVKDGATDSEFFYWVATAGQYSEFTGAVLPKYPSACSICLERGRPQLFRVTQHFFDLMGINAPLVTDGILLPWQVEETRGTIFVMAHGRTEAFDQSDCRLMKILADFAAMGVRQQRQQSLLVERTGEVAAAAMANKLAHRINNPLQSLTNILYLASEGHGGIGAQTLAQQVFGDLQKLSALVKQLLALPYREL